jgi:hypothetical protein
VGVLEVSPKVRYELAGNAIAVTLTRRIVQRAESFAEQADQVQKILHGRQNAKQPSSCPQGQSLNLCRGFSARRRDEHGGDGRFHRVARREVHVLDDPAAAGGPGIVPDIPFIRH